MMRRLIFIFCVTVFFGTAGGSAAGEEVPPGAEGGTFLSLSDLHFDPFFDPSLVESLAAADYRRWQGIFESSKIAGLGPFGRDSNYRLLQSALEALRGTYPDPDFILFSGDFLAHRFEENFARHAPEKSEAAYRNFVEKTIRFLARRFEAYYPRTPIVPALGNNDSFLGDYSQEPGGEFLRIFAESWLPVVSRGGQATSFAESFPVGGYYSLEAPGAEDLRILVLNGNFFSAKYAGGEGEDPGWQQLRWLEWNLYRSQLKGEKVWLVYHEPIGVDVFASTHKSGSCREDISMMWKAEYQDSFLEMVRRYSTVIEASFSGHTHADDFRLVFDAGEPVFFTHITPSISPVFGNNPGFQAFMYDRNSGALMDYESYCLGNLEEAGGSRSADWRKAYRFDGVYGERDPAPEDLADIFRSISARKSARSDFLGFYSCANRDATSKIEPLWRAYWCGIGKAGADEFADCYCGEGAASPRK